MRRAVRDVVFLSHMPRSPVRIVGDYDLVVRVVAMGCSECEEERGEGYPKQ